MMGVVGAAGDLGVDFEPRNTASVALIPSGPLWGASAATCAAISGAATNATNCGLRESSSPPITKPNPTTPTSALATSGFSACFRRRMLCTR